MQNEDEKAILNACKTTLKAMGKLAENCEFWIGKDDEESKTQARAFIDKLNWLIDICIYNENRIVEVKGGK